MCGVVGYSCENPVKAHTEILMALISESKIRGLHSFGYSYCSSGLVTNKYHNISDVHFPLAKKIIYHNRYSTSGDYQSHANNQPITIENISLVFNGVIDMRTKQEIEKHYGIQMETDNDGEILLRMCGSDPTKLQKYVQSMEGSFAGLILTENDTMYAIRNKNRPLWKLNHDDAVFYASTKDIFKRVNKLFEPYELDPNTLYES